MKYNKEKRKKKKKKPKNNLPKVKTELRNNWNWKFVSSHFFTILLTYNMRIHFDKKKATFQQYYRLAL